MSACKKVVLVQRQYEISPNHYKKNFELHIEISTKHFFRGS